MIQSLRTAHTLRRYGKYFKKKQNFPDVIIGNFANIFPTFTLYDVFLGIFGTVIKYVFILKALSCSNNKKKSCNNFPSTQLKICCCFFVVVEIIICFIWFYLICYRLFKYFLIISLIGHCEDV